MTTSAVPADRPRAVVHVDLDGARHIFQAHGWRYGEAADPFFESGLVAALECFEQAKVQATLFVIAEDVSDPIKRRLLEDALKAGHEVASHTMTHPRLTRLGRAAKRREIVESRAVLQAALGVDVQGFRAPGFHVDEEALELIDEAGYTYDSSVLAGRTGRSRSPYRPMASQPLLELPVPTRAPFSAPFHPSYSLVLGDWFFRSGLHAWRRRSAPFVFLLHLTDFAAPLPAAQVRGWRQRLFTLSHLPAAQKRARCAAMMGLVSQQFRVAPTSELLRDMARVAVRGEGNGE